MSAYDPKITIYTLWGWRKGADTPELLTAWDEISVDENREGWEEDCQRAIEAVGNELSSYRHARLRADYDAIVELWAEPEIEAEVRA